MAALTTVYGVNATKYKNIAAGTTGMADYISEAWQDNVKMVYDRYAVSADDTMAAGGIFTFGRLPKGARVLFSIVTYSAMSVAVTGTLKVGSTTIGAVTTMASAGSQVIGSAVAGIGTPITADSNITLTTADQTVPASATVDCVVFYIPAGIGVSAT